MSGPASAPPVGEWVAASPEETYRLGEHFGSFLKGGETVLLDGPLGAGKTIFVKGVAAALGIDEAEVTSPSFTLVNRYEAERLTLYHLDLYRLPEGSTAAHAVDLDDLLTDTNASIIIEWAQRMGRYRLPPPVWRITITGDGEEPRRITVSEVSRT